MVAGMAPRRSHAALPLLLLLLAGACHPQVPDRLSLIRLHTGQPTPPHGPHPSDFVDVFEPGLEGVPQFRWPHVTAIPSAAAGGRQVVLALAAACNATARGCTSALPPTFLCCQ